MMTVPINQPAHHTHCRFKDDHPSARYQDAPEFRQSVGRVLEMMPDIVFVDLAVVLLRLSVCCAIHRASRIMFIIPSLGIANRRLKRRSQLLECLLMHIPVR